MLFSPVGVVEDLFQRSKMKSKACPDWKFMDNIPPLRYILIPQTILDPFDEFSFIFVLIASVAINRIRVEFAPRSQPRPASPETLH